VTDNLTAQFAPPMSPVLSMLFVVALLGGTLGALIWPRLGNIGRVNYIGALLLLALVTGIVGAIVT
jgi:hypothetical protein